MRYHGEYGHLPALEYAKLAIKQIEDTWTPEQKDYIENDRWLPLPEGYDLNRLYMQILALQKTIWLNGDNFGFMRMKRIWFPQAKDAHIPSYKRDKERTP